MSYRSKPVTWAGRSHCATWPNSSSLRSLSNDPAVAILKQLAASDGLDDFGAIRLRMRVPDQILDQGLVGSRRRLQAGGRPAVAARDIPIHRAHPEDGARRQLLIHVPDAVRY